MSKFLVLLALFAAVVAAIETVPVADSTATIPRSRAMDDRVAAMRSDAERVSRLDRSRGVRRRDDNDDDDDDGHRRRGQSPGHIRKFDAAAADKLSLFDCDGLWYQIAVNADFAERFEKGCSCPIEIVQARNETFGDLNYACVNSTGDSKGITVVRGTKTLLPGGKFSLRIKGKSIGGKFLKAKDQNTHAEHVLAIDDDKQWVVTYAPKLRGVFVYSRSPKLDGDVVKRIFEFIESSSNAKVKANDMKLMKHTEQCHKLMRPLLRKIKSRSRSHSRSRSQSPRQRDTEKGQGSRTRSIERDDSGFGFSSGAEPSVLQTKADSARGSKQNTPNLDKLKGAWYVIARSKRAAETYERGCACSMSFIDVSGNAISEQCACLNTSATGDDKISSIRVKLEMNPNEPGMFQAKLLSRSPGALTEAETKPFSVILLAMGADFAVCLEPERKIVHVLGRKPALDRELLKAIGAMVESVGVNAADLESVKHDESICKDFHSKALERFGSGGGASVEKLDHTKPTAKNEGGQSETKQSSEERKPLMGHPTRAEKQSSTEFVDDSDGAPENYTPGTATLGANPMAAAPIPAATGTGDAATSPAPKFDTNTLAGNWFAIAVSNAGYDKHLRGCECTQAFITALDNNRIHSIGACMNTTDKQMVTCVSEGEQSADSPGLFRITPIDKQPYGLSPADKAKPYERVVLAVAKDFALIAEPELNAVAVLSRTPEMSAELYSRLTSLAEAIGFDKSQLRKINQANQQCQAVTDQMQALGKQAAEPAPVAQQAPAPSAATPPISAPPGPAALPAQSVAAPAAAKFAPAAEQQQQLIGDQADYIGDGEYAYYE